MGFVSQFKTICSKNRLNKVQKMLKLQQGFAPDFNRVFPRLHHRFPPDFTRDFPRHCPDRYTHTHTHTERNRKSSGYMAHYTAQSKCTQTESRQTQTCSLMIRVTYSFQHHEPTDKHRDRQTDNAVNSQFSPSLIDYSHH